jgi:hypothetical protein
MSAGTIAKARNVFFRFIAASWIVTETFTPLHWIRKLSMQEFHTAFVRAWTSWFCGSPLLNMNSRIHSPAGDGVANIGC